MKLTGHDHIMLKKLEQASDKSIAELTLTNPFLQLSCVFFLMPTRLLTVKWQQRQTKDKATNGLASPLSHQTLAPQAHGLFPLRPSAHRGLLFLIARLVVKITERAT